MNVLAQQAASNAVAAVQKPVADVTSALATEVSNGRALLDSVLKWAAEQGIAFAVSVLVALILLLVGSRLIRLLTLSTHKAL